MARDNRIRKIRSSNEPDYSERDDLFAQINERNAKVKEYDGGIKEYADLADTEKLAKAELLRKTGLVAFINKRCEDCGIEFGHKGLFIGNDAMLHWEVFFPMMDSYGSFNKTYQDTIRYIMLILEKIGVPQDNIIKNIYYYSPKQEQEDAGSSIPIKKIPAEAIYVSVDEALITGLIEKAVEDRYTPIKKKFDKAAGQSNHELISVAELIEKETGRQVADPHSEKIRSYSDTVIEDIKTDIRKKVTDELLGGIAKSAGPEECPSL
jgi:hypothetical protein